MYLINRAVAIVRIKQPCLDWINSTDGPSLTLKSVNRESHVYLLPEHDTEQERELIIQDLYKEIFELELAGFCRDQSQWPKISYQKFLDWFDIEVHSMVFDPYTEKIEKEEYWGG